MSVDRLKLHVIPITIPENFYTYILINEGGEPLIYPTRWLMRKRLNHPVSAGTIQMEMYHLSFLYRWAYEKHWIHLDQYFIQNDIADTQMLDSLVDYVRTHTHHKDRSRLNAQPFRARMTTIFQFLNFCLYRAHRGGELNAHEQAIMMRKSDRYREYHEELLAHIRVNKGKWKGRSPLTDEEIIKIRDAIAPRQNEHGEWIFNAFSKRTALRNWLFFLMGQYLGLRRGEILNIKRTDIPNGPMPRLRIVEHLGDPADTRMRKPALKTSERVLPLQRELRNTLKAYLTFTPQKGGRPQSPSPYLFLTEDGAPMSISTAYKVSQKIRLLSDVETFTWHKLRHTWATRVYKLLCDQEGGERMLKQMAGWRTDTMLEHYAEEAITERANAHLVEYIDAIFPEHQSTEAFS